MPSIRPMWGSWSKVMPRRPVHEWVIGTSLSSGKKRTTVDWSTRALSATAARGGQPGPGVAVGGVQHVTGPQPAAPGHQLEASVALLDGGHLGLLHQGGTGPGGGRRQSP